jgi:hypothetical protein
MPVDQLSIIGRGNAATKGGIDHGLQDASDKRNPRNPRNPW